MTKSKSSSRLKEYKLLSQEADEDSKNLLKSLGKSVKPRGRTCGTKTVICILVTCFITLIIGVTMFVALTLLYPDENFSLGLKEIYDELTKHNRTYYKNFTEEHTTDVNDLLLIPDSRNLSTVLNGTGLVKNGTVMMTLFPENSTESSLVNFTIGPLDGKEADFDLTFVEYVGKTLKSMEDYIDSLPLVVLISVSVAIALMILIPCIICCRRKIRQQRRRRLLGVLVSDLKSNEKNFAISESSDDEE